MSTDSGQWQAPTPGFIYIVKIGDFTHVLKPADQKSSDNLKLAQQAEANINLARILFTQHHDFLVVDRQSKMDEIITDTEEAINRVIRLLEPSRVEFISEESVRFNTRDTWMLADDHKSAATFGRLQITHNKLKTVLHDLSNIQTTAQLDNCDVRANIAVGSTGSTQAAPNGDTLSGPQDANNLRAWKATQRSKSVGSHASSSISRFSPNELAGGNPRSFNDISSAGTLLTNATGSAPRFIDGENLGRSERSRESISEAPGEHLPVIHELESVLYGSPPSLPRGSRKQTSTEERVELNGDERPSQPPGIVSRANTRSTTTSSGISSLDSPTSVRKKKTNHMKRETFADYRRKIREQRQQEQDLDHEQEQELGQEVNQQRTYDTEVTADPRNTLMPSPLFDAPAKELVSNPQTSGPNLAIDANPSGPSLQEEDTRMAKGLHQASLRSQTAPLVPTLATNPDLSRPSVQHRPASVAGSVPLASQSVHQEPEHTPRSAIAPRLVPASEIQRKNEYNSDREAVSNTPLKATQLTSPLRMQQSPLDQIHPPLSISTENIDARKGLPSVLRVANSKQPEQKTPLPYPISEEGSDRGDEVQSLRSVDARDVQNAVERFPEGFPKAAPKIRSTYPPQAIPQTSESTHNRSISGQIVPEISVTRVHTISRKPLPARGVSDQGARYVPLRTDPSPKIEMSKVNQIPIMTDIPALPNKTQDQNRHRVSPLPSPAPLESDQAVPYPDNSHRHDQESQRLQPIVSNHSRTSSVSAEESSDPTSSNSKPPMSNPLAMNPTSKPPSNTQQDLSSINGEVGIQSQWQPQQHYYQSPAWQQAPHFYPSFPLQTQQTTTFPHQQSSSDAQSTSTQPWQPLRTQTQPYPSTQDTSFATGINQPRRASEQGYVPPHVNARAAQIPPHPTVPAPPPPRHPNHFASSPQRQSAIPVKNGTGAATTEEPRKAIKDRELFGRQIYRSDEDKKPTSKSSPPIPPPGPPPQPRFEQKATNTASNALDQRLPNPLYHSQSASADVPIDTVPQNFQQQNQWQYSQQFNRPTNVVGEPSGPTMPEVAQAAAAKPKRKSWLAHQAGKLSAKQNKAVTKNSGPNVMGTIPDGNEAYPDRVRYA